MVAGGDGVAAEPPLVERLGDQATDVGVHPERGAEEDAEVVGDDGAILEEIGEARLAALAGVLSLRRLGELHLVAHEDQVARRHPGGDGVGEGHLTGLVDEEVVERADHLRPAEEPGGATDDAGRRCHGIGRLRRIEQTHCAAHRQGVVALLAHLEDAPGQVGALLQQLLQHVEDHGVAGGHHADALAVVE